MTIIPRRCICLVLIILESDPWGIVSGTSVAYTARVTHQATQRILQASVCFFLLHGVAPERPVSQVILSLVHYWWVLASSVGIHSQYHWIRYPECSYRSVTAGLEKIVSC